MLGKVFSFSLIILGVYILASYIASLTTPEDQSGSSPYHLGCYEADPSLNASQRILNYLTNLSASLNKSSVTAVKVAQSAVDHRRVEPGAANAVALEFKKYIKTYENIKSLNDYEKAYNKGLR